MALPTRSPKIQPIKPTAVYSRIFAVIRPLTARVAVAYILVTEK